MLSTILLPYSSPSLVLQPQVSLANQTSSAKQTTQSVKPFTLPRYKCYYNFKAKVLYLLPTYIGDVGSFLTARKRKKNDDDDRCGFKNASSSLLSA